MSTLFRPPPVWLLVTAVGVSPLALNMLVPSMPALVDEFGTDTATVQLTLSLYLVGVALGQFIYGPLSDRFGRRPLLLTGFVIYVVACLLSAMASSIDMLILGRVMQAIGGCSGMVIGRVIVRDVWSGDQATRILATITAAMSLAPMLGPALGGLLHEWIGWQAGFLVTGGVGVLVLAAVTVRLTETHPEKTPLPNMGALLAAYRSLLARPKFLGNALVMTMNSAGYYTFLAGAPYTTISLLGRSPTEYGILFGFLFAGYIVGNLMVSRLAGQVSTDRLLRAGLWLSFVPTVLLGLALAVGWFNIWTLYGLSTVMCIGQGLVMPITIARAVEADLRLAGTASGLMGTMQMGLGAVVIYVIGALEAFEPTTMIIGMILTNLLAFFASRHGKQPD